MILSKQKKLEFIRTSGNAGVLFWLFFLERFPVFLVGDFIFLRIFIVKCFQLIHEGGGATGSFARNGKEDCWAGKAE